MTALHAVLYNVRVMVVEHGLVTLTKPTQIFDPTCDSLANESDLVGILLQHRT